jgi:hypothetical protein
MVDQFNEARVFVPEVATTILGLLDVLLLLRSTYCNKGPYFVGLGPRRAASATATYFS